MRLGTNRGSRVGTNTGDTGFVEGKKGGGASGSASSWQWIKFDLCGDNQLAISGQDDRSDPRKRVPWKSDSESSTGRLEAVGQVLLLSRWQAATRRPAAPCKSSC